MTPRTDREAAAPLTTAGRALLAQLDYIGAHSQDTSFPMALDDVLAIERQAAALHAVTGPELDMERVRHALGVLYPWQSGPVNAKDAARFVREYAALGDSR
jgi:hypothetical protein